MKKFLKFSALFLLVVLTMTGCKKSYTITVKSNNPEWGTVSGGGSYKDGEIATISAIPQSGYYFIAWNDGNVENPRKITVSGNAEFTATFSDNPAGGGTEGAQELSGSISANTTLRDLGLPVDYIIDGRFYVEGNALLTIEPGVTIMFTGVYDGITVEENAGLCMVGTADKPITLTGPTNNQNVGAWDNVVVKSNRSDNRFEYVNFINGGSYEEVVLILGKLSMKHCTVNGASNYGVFVGMDAKLAAYENNTVKNTKCPLLLANHESVNSLGAGNTYTNNTINMIEVDNYWLDGDNLTVTYTNQGVPYLMKAGVHVGGTAIMAVNAGVEIVMPYDKEVDVEDHALLQVNGTASQPVIFRGELNENGYWDGIDIDSERQTNGGSYLTHCNILNAGDEITDAALSTDGDTRLTLTNVTISGSVGYGMKIYIPTDWETEEYDFSHYYVTATGLTFSNCAMGNIYEENKGMTYTTWPGNKKLAKK